MIATQTHTQCATEDGGSIPPRTLSYWDHWVKVPQNKESMWPPSPPIFFLTYIRKGRTGVTFSWRRYFWGNAFSKTPGWPGYRVGKNTTPGMALTPATNPLLKLHTFLIYQWFILRSHSIIRWTKLSRIISCVGSEDKWCWICDDDSELIQVYRKLMAYSWVININFSGIKPTSFNALTFIWRY